MQRQRQAERQTARSVDKGHGRREARTLTSTVALNGYLDWPGVGQVCRVERRRTCRGRTEAEVAYYVTSLRPGRADARRLLELSRGHWGASENRLHYVRDEAFGEDRCTIASGHAPQNLACLRNTALSWLRQLHVHNVTATLRRFARNSLRLFTQLGYVK